MSDGRLPGKDSAERKGRGMTTTEPPQANTGQADERGGLVAPWWHTSLMVLLIGGLSVAGVRQLRSFGNQPLHLAVNYTLTIAYEWVLAALAVWGIHMRKIPLRQLLGERRPGVRGWLEDIGVALGYWVIAVCALALLSSVLVKISGSHIDPQKIGDVTQKLAPVSGVEMLLFLVLSISAGICEELVFRGYLQQQFARMGRSIWVGVTLSALVFGGAHGYEGVAGVLLIAAYGAMFGVLALLRRGLRAGMIAHAWHDSISGLALVLLRHYGLHVAGK
jgi:membrane protease YdiL (CAAX protease family)